MVEAKLVYIIDGVQVELESMELEALDQFTYNVFDKEEDILNSPRYKNKLGDLPKGGELKVVFNGFDVPVTALDYFTAFGNDPFNGEQSLDVLVGSREIAPSERSFRLNVARTLNNVRVVKEFHDVFKDSFTKKEEFCFVSGLMSGNPDDIFMGIKRIIGEAISGADGYLIGRVFLDGMSKFEHVRNKDEKGRLYSAKLLQKK